MPFQEATDGNGRLTRKRSHNKAGKVNILIGRTCDGDKDLHTFSKSFLEMLLFFMGTRKNIRKEGKKRKCLLEDIIERNVKLLVSYLMHITNPFFKMLVITLLHNKM